MDVRKPKLVKNWRELLKEWGIIVLGVLTALLAEQAVQSFEWRNKVDAAIADMDNELGSGDGPQAYARVSMHDCIASRLSQIRAAVERGDRKQSRKLIDSFWLPKGTYDSMAREAANASDIASHMPHERMLQYRITYEVVPDMDRLADRELADLAHLRALPATGGLIGTAEKLSAIDAVEALKLDNDAIVRESQFVLNHMLKMKLPLDRAFVELNLKEPRNHYQGCLQVPPHLR
jgi:hypothetical protein